MKVERTRLRITDDVFTPLTVVISFGKLIFCYLAKILGSEPAPPPATGLKYTWYKLSSIQQ